MNKIIVGYDGTDQGRDALALGAALARVTEARLIVASAMTSDTEARPARASGRCGGARRHDDDPPSGK